MPEPTKPTTVSNLNIASLADNIATYIAEVEACQSKDHPMLSVADEARINSYIASIDSVVQYTAGAPVLDMPNFDPAVITLNPVPAEGEFENQFVTHISRLLRAFHNEVIAGNSARMVSGIDSNDLGRWNDYIANLIAYMAGPVAAINPGDLPETGGSTGADARNS